MKFYTDPSFFFNLWMQSMIQLPSNHHATRSGKHDRHRSPVNSSLFVLYLKAKNLVVIRKEQNYIIKNRFMLPIQHHHLNLVSFNNHPKNNNIVVHKNSIVIEENMIQLLEQLIDLIDNFYNIQIIIIIIIINIPI